MQILKKLTTLSILIMSPLVVAQEAPKFNLSGSIDTYYRVNLNAPNNKNTQAPGTSFANLPGFALGMVNLIASHEGKKTGFVADLVFGPRGTDAVFASPMYSASGNVINQMYAYWNINNKVKLTIGNFNTFLGYEVISPIDNFNYSTSYLFSYGPFSHAGLKADFVISDDFNLMLSIMNDTDLTEFNPTNDYAIGSQIDYKGQYLNFLVDPSFTEIDFTGGFDFSDSFFLGINANYLKLENNAGGFAGVALYPQYSISEAFTLGLRGEFFKEEGNFGAIGTGVDDSSVLGLTFTGSYSIENLIIKPEFRIDSASDNAFLNNDLGPQRNLSSFIIASIYCF